MQATGVPLARIPSLVRGRKWRRDSHFRPRMPGRTAPDATLLDAQGSWGCRAGRVPTPGRARNRPRVLALPASRSLVAYSAGILRRDALDGSHVKRTPAWSHVPAQGQGTRDARRHRCQARHAQRYPGRRRGGAAARSTPRRRHAPRGCGQRSAQPPGAGPRPRLLVPPLAAVISGVPALLTRRISKLAVHVLGSTVSPVRQRSRSETNQARESPDCQQQGGEEEKSLPPRHLDHLDPSGR